MAKLSEETVRRIYEAGFSRMTVSIDVTNKVGNSLLNIGCEKA